MGNKSFESKNPTNEKLKRLLEKSYDQNELKFRITELAKSKLSEDIIVSSLTPEIIRKSFENDLEYMKDLLIYINDSLLLLANKKAPFTEEEGSLVIFFLTILARIIPVIYEVLAFFIYIKFILKEKHEKFFKRLFWEDNANLSIDEVNLEDQKEMLSNNDTIEKKKSKIIVIKSNSIQIKEEKVILYIFILANLIIFSL